MDEQVFLQDQSATVTSSRVVINGQTFATRNIGSVGVKKMPASRLGALLLVLFGCGIASALVHPLAGVAVLIGGLIWVFTLKGPARLVIMAGGGEVVALESKDVPRIQQLHDAVAKAISVR